MFTPRSEDWLSDMPEKAPEPVGGIKALPTAVLTRVLRLCWPGISWLICEPFAGLAVMDALLKSSYNLERLKQWAFLQHTGGIKWQLWTSWMSREFTQSGNESSSHRTLPIKTFRTRIVPLNQNLNTSGHFFFNTLPRKSSSGLQWFGVYWHLL